MPYLYSAAIVGIEAIPVTVETDIAFGLASFNIVGLPDASVRESRDRIRSAIRRSQFSFPRYRVTVNLAPANLKKQGALFDLPIALSILVAQGECDPHVAENIMILGELSLDGTVRPIQGALTAALSAKSHGMKYLFLPKENAAEASEIESLDVRPISSLKQFIQHLRKEKEIPRATPKKFVRIQKLLNTDFSHIKGQTLAKRGLEIAAAGGHNVLLKGPPGTGKTLLAKSMPGILPLLTKGESLEVTSIASVSGNLPNLSGLIHERPFRAPHHSCSAVSLIGGGSWPRPGEVSLAHRGVLFLDELPEFTRHVLEHLRQPLEDGEVVVARAAASVRFPARFLLIATMNPCPCGFATDPKRSCTCSPREIGRYQKRVSGPLLDRFDLVIEVPNIDAATLLEIKKSEPSNEVRSRVVTARELQHARFQKTPLLTNTEIPPSKLDEWCRLDGDARSLIELAISSQHLSARGVARVRKVARTIADLEKKTCITADHIAEALQFRSQDQNTTKF